MKISPDTSAICIIHEENSESFKTKSGRKRLGNKFYSTYRLDHFEDELNENEEIQKIENKMIKKK
jgi:hypothetical protein